MASSPGEAWPGARGGAQWAGPISGRGLHGVGRDAVSGNPRASNKTPAASATKGRACGCGRFQRASLPVGGRRERFLAAAPGSHNAGTAPPSGFGPRVTLTRSAAPRVPSPLPPQPVPRLRRRRPRLVFRTARAQGRGRPRPPRRPRLAAPATTAQARSLPAGVGGRPGFVTGSVLSLGHLTTGLPLLLRPSKPFRMTFTLET